MAFSTKAAYVYSAQLDDSQVLAALKRIDANIAKMANNANKGFGGAGSAAGASGAEIGAIAGVVSAVADQFIQLGTQAISTLVDIGKQSVQTALEIDVLKARLVGIFDGSEEAANQAFGFIQDKSRELGLDLSELAGAFLPKVESMSQFERVAKIAAALAKSDPEQGAIGARIALIEALSGTFTSLQRRFEIPKEDIERIQQAFDTQGMEGFVSELEKVLEESGKDFDTLAGTAQASFDKVAIAGEQLGGRFGEPIVESLESLAQKFLEFYDANEEDLIVLADALGSVVGNVISLLEEIDLTLLDIPALIEFANQLYNIIESVRLFAAEIQNASPAVQSFFSILYPILPLFEAIAKAFFPIVSVIENFSTVMVIATQGMAFMNATGAALEAQLKTMAMAFNELVAAAQKLAAGDLEGAANSLKNAAAAATDTSAATEAFKASMDASNARMSDYKSSVDSNVKSQEKLRESIQATKNAGTGLADELLAGKQANKAAAEATNKQAEEQKKAKEAAAKQAEKINKQIEAEQRNFQNKLKDIDIKAEREKTDILVESGQKRLDLAREHADDIKDINLKNSQAIQDAAIDLRRDEEDIARKYSQKAIDNEKSKRDKIVEVEAEHLDKLKNIRDKFNQDSLTAERNRDAIAFLEAMRQRDLELANAKDERDEGINEAKTAAIEAQVEIDKQRQYDIENARIAHERRLADLQRSLQNELSAKQTAYQRELSEIQVWETRKLEALKVARDRDIEDAKRAHAQKLSDLRAQLAEEQSVLSGKSTVATGASGKTSQKPASVFGGGPVGFVGKSKASEWLDMIKGTFNGLQPFARGGQIKAGQFAMVGERGPELFVPQSAGTIIPNAQMMQNMTPSSVMNSISNSRATNINLPVATPSQLLDPMMLAQIRNVVMSALGEVT